MCHKRITGFSIFFGLQPRLEIHPDELDEEDLLTRSVPGKVHLEELNHEGKRMKKVLFATTALAALSMSGAAFAGAHDSGNFGISGETVVGYNDNIENGIFQETNIDLKASKDLGDYQIDAHGRLNFDWNEGTDEDSDDDSTTAEVEFKKAALKTPVGTLTFADSQDGTGASDRFYKDRDGMALDVQNLDGIGSLQWEGNVGQFNYAVDTGSIENAVSDDWSVGLGTDIAVGGGDIGLGFGYDNNSGGTNSDRLGIGADFSFGMVEVGTSYMTGSVGGVDETSVAVDLGFNVTPELEIGAYYAQNDVADNKYGVTLDYETGPITIAIDYDTGDGATVDNYEIDVSYDTGAGITLYAGYDDQEANTASVGTTGAFYVGAEIAIADGIEATVAYAEADEIGGPEFKDGTSAFLKLKY